MRERVGKLIAPVEDEVGGQAPAKDAQALEDVHAVRVATPLGLAAADGHDFDVVPVFQAETLDNRARQAEREASVTRLDLGDVPVGTELRHGVPS